MSGTGVLGQSLLPWCSFDLIASDRTLSTGHDIRKTQWLFTIGEPLEQRSIGLMFGQVFAVCVDKDIDINAEHPTTRLRP
jgi:hypothetical protein